MEGKLLILAVLGMALNANAQARTPHATVERVNLEYDGKRVNGKKLTVSSEIPMDIERAWANVKTPALLKFVAKGMIRFKPEEGGFPPQWNTGETYKTKMLVFGFVPFGGTHYLVVKKTDDENHQISTREWDKAAKVWNHQISLNDLGNGKIHYEDTIVIYGGRMTGLITSFAKHFYKHRQKRWQLVARENLLF